MITHIGAAQLGRRDRSDENYFDAACDLLVRDDWKQHDGLNTLDWMLFIKGMGQKAPNCPGCLKEWDYYLEHVAGR